MNLESANTLKSKILSMVQKRSGARASAQGAGKPEPATRRVAVGIGATRGAGGEPTFRPVVRVQERKLRDLHELVALKREHQIDLSFVGKIVAQNPWNQGRFRPLQPGVSVGHYKGDTGTLGCFVVKTDDPAFVGVLSCQHVLSELLTGGSGPTEYTIQPGRADKGHPVSDRIGHVAAAVPLPNPPGHLVNGKSTLDCAVSRVDPALAKAGPSIIPGVGPITGVATDLLPYLNRREMVLFKQGRTTGLTKGVMTGVNLDEIVVTYNDRGWERDIAFTGAFQIEELNGGKFSSGGDSGSVIVDRQGLVLGLLFAGSKYGGADDGPCTFALPIQPILSALGVTIPTAAR